MKRSARRTAFTVTAAVTATVTASTTVSMLTATTAPAGRPAVVAPAADAASADADTVSAGAGRPGGILVSAAPQQLSVVGLPCFPGTLALTMTNTGSEGVYADLTVTPTGPLQLSRQLFSSYLPATEPDQPVSAPVEVRVPREAQPGAYRLDLQVDRTKLTVPVQVNPLPPKGPGSNLALGEQPSASSTHGNFAVCGALDGDKDSKHWDTLTGWNDGTRAVFPDSYDVALAAPATIDRVELYTLDSARYPARANGLRDWDVQVRTGTGDWRTVAQVRGNTRGHATSTFAPVEATAVRILALAANDNAYSRIVELEVYGG
ncbi:coagulation factor 5/8 type domain protein [Kribbella flavida DSM 17836]|uniref:Coagulation factor 5/8 type domain protein n=1 Tax=Kribbella flavida (strain DSM 17836 / JCM 10339 / NBRC 14399) TaxID=479435 RepID=D2Q2B0_KRIFD|nr:discoidin domain-containing protein [Kribbella flavida]ADB35806.1 coagulation factor 5/8 type domain protein [Kribbella flavida DSM 17836]